MPSQTRKRRPYTPRMPAAERRAQLLDAAIAIIARDGYGAVSIDGIAREAGVSRTVVYGVFDSLNELLYALLDRQEQRALAQLIDALPAGLDGGRLDVTIVAVIRRWVHAVAGDPVTWRPILLSPEGTPAPVRERIARDRELLRTRIRDLLDATPLRTHAELAAHAAIGLGEYFGRLILEDPAGFDTDALAEGAQALLGGLG